MDLLGCHGYCLPSTGLFPYRLQPLLSSLLSLLSSLCYLYSIMVSLSLLSTAYLCVASIVASYCLIYWLCIDWWQGHRYRDGVHRHGHHSASPLPLGSALCWAMAYLLSASLVIQVELISTCSISYCLNSSSSFAYFLLMLHMRSHLKVIVVCI